jgi:NTP pyrophosphatase (non-canonical NTP hydrolase)
MNFNEYQEKSRKTARYRDLGDNLPYLTLGLVGETGEVADKLKKLIRDEEFTSMKDLTEEQKNALVSELGDVIWYIAQMATELGIPFDSIAERNIEKIYSRLERGRIGGSGDTR